MSSKINIVLAADSNYAQHATVAMTSVLVNTCNPGAVQFFIIDDNICHEDKQRMNNTVNTLGGKVCFVHVPEAELAEFFVSGNLTRAAYLRLYIPHILPAYVDKVIYLDCDLLVLKDIAELWSLKMAGKPIAAADDFGILASKRKRAEKEKNLGWKENYSYFNSGVLIIDIKQWRSCNYAEKLVRLVKERNFRHHDQDALNLLFMNNWCRVPLCWNVIPPVFNFSLRVALNKAMRQKARAALQNAAIIHYAGGYKPWEYKNYQGFNDKYYEYLAKTGYRDAKMPQPNLNKKGHSIFRQLWRMKLARMLAER